MPSGGGHRWSSPPEAETLTRRYQPIIGDIMQAQSMLNAPMQKNKGDHVNVYEAIAARRTIRDFAGKPVESSILHRLLEAGMKAPSFDHLREWMFALVDDRDQRERLVSFFRKEWTAQDVETWIENAGMVPERQKAMYRDAVPKQAEMILSAGALVIPCFKQRAPLLERKSGLHELNAFASVWALLENILIAGASEGVFGVTKIVSTPAERDHIRDTLAVPSLYEIPCYLALGYPRDDAFLPEQTPVKLEERIHINQWAAQS